VNKAFPKLTKDNLDQRLAWDQGQLRKLVEHIGKVADGHGQAAEWPKVIAEGKWSKPVDDNRGYAVRGRLVLCEKRLGDDRREVAVYVELQDASKAIGGSMQLFCDFGKTDFRPEYKGGLQCELRDQDKQPVKSTSYSCGGAIPKSQWVTLTSGELLHLCELGLFPVNKQSISISWRSFGLRFRFSWPRFRYCSCRLIGLALATERGAPLQAEHAG
jgi:hypothetical protein